MPRPRGTYRVSPNRSSQTLDRRSPAVRHRSRNSSVTEAPPEVLGDHRGARAVVPDDHRGGTVAAGGLVGRRGQAVAEVGQDHQRGAGARGGQAGPQGTDPGPEGPAEVEGADLGGLAQGGVDGGGVGLVEIGRGGGGEPDGARGPPPGRTGGPAGPPPPPWWWCPRRGRPPTVCPCRLRSRTAGSRRSAAGADRGRSRRC